MTKLRNTYLSLGLAIIASLSFVQPASADVDIKQTLETAGITQTTITAEPVQLTFDRSPVSSTPAPKMEAPVVAVQYSQPEAPTTVTSSAPVAKNETPKVAVTPVASETPKTKAPNAKAQAAPRAASSGNGAAILASAYAQIGITQDCTAMVERALGSVGIITGDIGPADFFRFGTVVSNPQPGDLMISPGHVAVYAGNGTAISGGFNGNQTISHPAKYLSGVVYVRV